MSPATALMVIAVKVATPMERRIFRVFILISFHFWPVLHCTAG
jgi:nitrate reductase NapE component